MADFNSFDDKKSQVDHGDIFDGSAVRSSSNKGGSFTPTMVMDDESQDKSHFSGNVFDNSPANTNTQVMTVEEKRQLALSKIGPKGFKINIADPQQIAFYGAASQEKIANFEDTVLKHIKTSSSGEIGKKLVQIIGIAQQLNISEINGTSSGIPLIGRLIDSFKRNREKFISHFNSLADQIDRVVAEIDASTDSLKSRIEVLEELYKQNTEEYELLDRDIRDGKAFITKQKSEWTNQRAEAEALGYLTDPVVVQSYNDWKRQIEMFAQRVSDLEAAQMIAVQTWPEIRMIQSSNQLLINKFSNAKTLTIPMWRKQFTMAASLEETKKGADIADFVDNASNEFYKNTAKLLGETTTQVARASQRSIIDLSSLQTMQNSLINTFDELKKISEEGEKKREEMSIAIVGMKNQLRQKLASN